MAAVFHYHKDCEYYKLCEEHRERIGECEYILFKCPMRDRQITYLPKDIHTNKWGCTHFVETYGTDESKDRRNEENCQA